MLLPEELVNVSPIVDLEQMSLNVYFFWSKIKLFFMSAYTLSACRKDSAEEMHIKKYLTNKEQTSVARDSRFI